MAEDYLDFLKGFEEEDFGLEAVSAEELSEKIIAPTQTTETLTQTSEALQSNITGISNLETKIDSVISQVKGLNALLDFDELNIEGKLDDILEKVDNVQAAAPSEVNAVVEESAETKDKLDKIMAAIGDPEKRKAEVEKRLAEAIEKKKEEVDGKLKEVESMIIPLLVNFIKPESLEKKYIYWPNRKPIIERQIKKIMQVTRG
jgi:chromosome segregation ATPase